MKNKNYVYHNGMNTKIFGIFSVINWEEVFVRQFSLMGDFNLFTWPSVKNYFDRKSEWKQYHKQLNAKLIKAFDEFYTEAENIIVFSYTSDFILNKKTLLHLNKNNVLFISFCWDDLLYFKGRVNSQPIGVVGLSRFCDINLTMSPEAIPRYNAHKSPCLFWDSVPILANHSIEISELHRTYVKFYVLFIGSNYGRRGHFIKQLINNGINVKCYGSGWPNGYLSQEEIESEIKKAPVTLGFANVGYTKNITTIKGRDFEIPLWGGLYLTQFSRGVQKYYDLGTEVVAYKNIKDCISKIEWIKKYPIEASKIRENGYRKAMTYCTWDSRFAFLKELIQKVRA